MRAQIVLVALLAATGCSAAATPPPVMPAPQSAARATKPDTQAAKAAAPRSDIKPYREVIPETAVSDTGLFVTHKVGPKLFYEIPREELGEEMLLVTQIARNTLGEGYGGEAVGNRVLRWERQGDRILLRGVSYEITADSTLPIYQAVEAANYDAVLAALDIKAFGPDSAAVVEVSDLFTTKSPEFAPRIDGTLDKGRSFVERVAAYPKNVEVEATQTYTVTPERPEGAPSRYRPSPKTASVRVHWSMVRLPEDPMTPRLHDSRVGFFSVGKQDFGTGEHRAARRRYITRWRLECPAGETIPCEPLKPITYYVDPATPTEWRPWIKEGIEDWQEAFEEAGFINAIVAADAPTPEEDPNWSPEDARYSVIRWLPSTIENAQGPHVHDPRTGEILESDIKMYHNVMNLLRDWYFVQAAPLDARAQRLPLPDSLMGRLLQYVVAHEVGHTLGFPHNQKASATYSADSLRNPDFLRRMGHTPTLMDYSRFNYVAQPEDEIPPELLIPDIGPYDKFATMWGYRPIPEADTPEEEQTVLDAWARRQDEEPYLRFSTTDTEGADAGDHTEAVGDADPVQSTRLGLANIRRTVPMLIPAVRTPGEDFSDLEELYDRLVGQWARELSHVTILVGGVESQEKYWGQEGVRFTPVSRARQAEAIRFLNREAFRTPEYFLRPEILRRIEVEGAIERIGRAQGRILSELLDDDRIQRMVEYEALADRPASVYGAGEMLSDVRQGIWSELSDPRVEIDAFRRNLQRSYLERVADKLDPEAKASAGEAQALLRGELMELDTALERSLRRAADASTRAHLRDARYRIERVLEPGD